MASNILACDQLNFTRMGIASVDEIKVVLADILRCEIKPQDLPKSITSCSELTSGRQKLRPSQNKLCCPSPPAVPDYNKFDVSLLYKLIRNLCPQLKPTRDWGESPSTKHIQIGDDIERLRVFRNEMFAHLDSSSVDDGVFTSQWRDLEQIFQRMQTFLNTKGISVDYEKKLAAIAKSDFGFEDMEKYKIILEGLLHILKENDDNDGPSITIHGNDKIVFGEKTCFEAVLERCQPSNNWPITWEKIQGNITEQLDTSRQKYRGSSSRCLVIADVSKEDEGEYRAVISRENNGTHVKIPSNSMRLTVIGDLPALTMPNAVEVPYGSVAVFQPDIQACPPAETVEWQKSSCIDPISDDFKSLNLNSPKFSGSTLDPANSKLVINETNFEDSLFYRLVVENRVGKSSCSSFLKIVGTSPNVIIKDDTDFLEKSVTLICKVLCESSHPLTGVVWTKDNNEINVINSEGKYTGSKIDNPSLKITNVNASDAGIYQCCVSNVVGSTQSEQVILALPIVKLLIKKKDIQNGTLKLQAAIRSIPDAFKIEWKAQMTPDDDFQPINLHEETYKGSTPSLPNPLLVANKYNSKSWETYRIEVTNFLGVTFVTSQEAQEDTNLPTDSTLGSLNGINLSLYMDNGPAKIRFNNLRLSLIKGITKEEMANLKDTLRRIRSMDPDSLRNVEDVEDVREFVNHLIDKKVFTERDVITLQYLMRTIEREDLDKECIDYATSVKGRLCFFEQENQADGCTRVKLHVVDDIENFKRLDCVIETVAAMVRCDPKSIQVVGILHEHSFIIVIEVQRKLAMLLLRKPAEEIAKLADFKIDRIEIDGEVITVGKQGAIWDKRTQMIGIRDEEKRAPSLWKKERFHRELGYGLTSLSISQGMHGRLQQSRNNPLSRFDEKRVEETVATKDENRKVTALPFPSLPIRRTSTKRHTIMDPLFYHFDQKRVKETVDTEDRKEFNRTLKRILQLPGDTEEDMEDSIKKSGENKREVKYIEKTVGQYQNKESMLEKLEDFDISLQNMNVVGQNVNEVKSFLSGPCTNLFRKILRKYILEEDFITRIKSSKDKLLPLLTVDQQSMLYPEKGSFSGSYKNLDVPLIYILFKNICFIEPHKKGWGKTPDPLDTSVAACIDSIMEIYREYFCNPPLFLEQSDFDRILKRILKLLENIEEELENPKMDVIIRDMEKKEKEEIKKDIPGQKFRDLSISHHLGSSVIRTSSITVPGVDNVYDISCKTSDRLWISDRRRLLQVDNTGHMIQEMEIAVASYPPTGAHSITDDGDLIFINGNKVQKMTLDGIITTLLERYGLLCIHSSRINDDILVGYCFGVARFEGTGAYQVKLGYMIYNPKFITENKNGDIWVSGVHTREVVVMDKLGRHRFNYSGQHQCQHQCGFHPGGICTDILGQVLVCDEFNSSVHLLDQDGQFLRLLLTEEHGLHLPTALCVDDKHNLYVGEMLSNKITVYTYLQETEDSKSSIVESK